MNRKNARNVASLFVFTYVKTGRQWTVADLDGCLPRGYELYPFLEAGDLYPLTVEHIADVVWHNATVHA
jgi:hypothetical protein